MKMRELLSCISSTVYSRTCTIELSFMLLYVNFSRLSTFMILHKFIETHESSYPMNTSHGIGTVQVKLVVIVYIVVLGARMDAI